MLDGSTPCERSGPAASPGQVATDAEGHSHRGPTAQQPITEAERIELAAQQEQARAAAARYPTVADAEADGYRMSVAFVPCIGAHYTNVAARPVVRPGPSVGAAVRRHQPRLEDRRPQLPRLQRR